MITENIQSKHLFSNHEPENTHTLDRTPDDYSMDYQSIYLQTPDGEFIHAYWIYQAEDVHSSTTLLYLHGAGGNISHRLEVVRLFYDNLRCNILIIDYRGECASLKATNPDEADREMRVNCVRSRSGVYID